MLFLMHQENGVSLSYMHITQCQLYCSEYKSEQVRFYPKLGGAHVDITRSLIFYIFYSNKEGAQIEFVDH